MRKAIVYNNGKNCGLLSELDSGEYEFRYADTYFSDPNSHAISLTLPKDQQTYHSEYLFPFFFGLLAEGVNKETQCRLLKIDETDHFSQLLATASQDTIGAITVELLEE